MDGDGYENVTSKVNSRSFKFYRLFWSMSIGQMLAVFSGVSVEFKKTVSKFRKRKEVVVAFSRRFRVAVVQWRQCNVPKRVMHVQSCMFCQYKLIAFMSFSLNSPSSLLKFRNIVLVGAAINVYKLVSSSKLSQKFPPSLFARRSRTRASKLNFPFSIVC